MTMPHLMNCGHLDNGWCLDCVKEQWEELDRAKEEADSSRVLIERIQSALCTAESGDALLGVVAAAHSAEMQQCCEVMQRDAIESLFDNVVSKSTNTDGSMCANNPVIRHTPQDDTIIRLRRAMRSIVLCAQNALETMPHGSDRYDLAVAVDHCNEALK